MLQSFCISFPSTANRREDEIIAESLIDGLGTIDDLYFFSSYRRGNRGVMIEYWIEFEDADRGKELRGEFSRLFNNHRHDREGFLLRPILGTSCRMCGLIPPAIRGLPPQTCPNKKCNLEDITPCPYCDVRSPAARYKERRGLYWCPRAACGHQVKIEWDYLGTRPHRVKKAPAI